MNNYEQLTLQGDSFETIKSYAQRVQEYEKRKQILMMTCTSCEELEKELRKLTEELKI